MILVLGRVESDRSFSAIFPRLEIKEFILVHAYEMVEKRQSGYGHLWTVNKRAEAEIYANASLFCINMTFLFV